MMDNADLETLASDLGLVLKSEQKEAVESLFKGRDVFGVLQIPIPVSLYAIRHIRLCTHFGLLQGF